MSGRVFNRLMRAIQVREFGGAEVLKYFTDIPRPSPSTKQVLIRVHAAGVNPLDTYIRTGKHPIKPSLPYIPGNDAAGIIEETGTGARKFKEGDRAYCCQSVSGTYAEYAVADEVTTFPLPPGTDFEAGASLGIPYLTAYRALVQRCRVKPNEILLVHGASGAVGVACCQIGRSLGMRVLGTAGTEEGLELVLKNGAHQAFNHRKPNYVTEILKATDDGGVDVIMEMLANINLETDLKIVKKFGRIGMIGSRGVIEVTPRLAMGKESAIYGVLLYQSTPEEYAEGAAFVYAGLEQGTLRPIVGNKYPLERAADAHVDVIEHKDGAKGKIVLMV